MGPASSREDADGSPLALRGGILPDSDAVGHFQYIIFEKKSLKYQSSFCDEGRSFSNNHIDGNGFLSFLVCTQHAFCGGVPEVMVQVTATRTHQSHQVESIVDPHFKLISMDLVGHHIITQNRKNDLPNQKVPHVNFEPIILCWKMNGKNDVTACSSICWYSLVFFSIIYLHRSLLSLTLNCVKTPKNKTASNIQYLAEETKLCKLLSRSISRSIS